jgi:arsenite methyltransferase
VSQLVFDVETARRIEAAYHVRDAIRRRRIVREALAAARGQRLLDAGCGPGFYCVELAEEVGPEGSVVGVDGSPAMLELARSRCAGRENVDLRHGEVTALPAEDASFDGAICVQVLEYVADATAALAELYRAVRPGGRVVVFDVDWATLSLHAENSELSERVLEAWDEHLVHRSLPRTLAARLRSAGFDDVRMEAHAFATAEWDPESYGVAILPLVADFAAGRKGLTEADAREWASELHALGERGEFYFASTQCCFSARKPAAGG